MSNKKSRITYRHPSRPQQGVVLIVGLVMVLLITIVGLAAVRGTGLQETMAGNMRDRNLAFQAAESALRMGEARVALDIKVLPPFNCTVGNCLHFAHNDVVGYQPQNAVELWDSAKWDEFAFEVDLTLDGVAQKPQVIVEEVASTPQECAANDGGEVGMGGGPGADCQPYRITAKGYGASAGTVVIVQSSFMRQQ